MKRHLVISVLALSVLGGCAANVAPAKVPAATVNATADSTTAATAAATKVAAADKETAFIDLVLSYRQDPAYVAYDAAIAAHDYKTAREVAAKSGAAIKTAADAIAAADWGDKIKADIDAYVATLRTTCSERALVAATSTDAETKDYLDLHYQESFDNEINTPIIRIRIENFLRDADAK